MMGRSHTFEYFFHAVLNVGESLPSDEYLAAITNPKIRGVAEAFRANADRVISSVFTPMAIVFWARAQQETIDSAMLEVWGNLEVRTESDPETARYQEVLARRQIEFEKQRYGTHEEFGQSIMLASAYLEVLRSRFGDIRIGLDSILGAAITATWTAFESLAGDLWEEALNAHPQGLATLTGKPPKRHGQYPRNALKTGGDQRFCPSL